MHNPWEQAFPEPQAWAQLPQWDGSVCVSTQSFHVLPSSAEKISDEWCCHGVVSS